LRIVKSVDFAPTQAELLQRMNKKQRKTSPKAALQSLIAALTPAQLKDLAHAAFPPVDEQPLPPEIQEQLGAKVQQSQKQREEQRHKAAVQRLAESIAGAVKNAPTLAGDTSPIVKRPRGRAAIWKPIVLETLRKIPFYSTAAKAAGISRDWLLQYREAHPDFAQQCELAMAQAADGLGAQLWARAFGGTTEPIWSRDEKGRPVKVDERRVYDHKLGMFLLQTHARDRYFLKSQTEVTGPGGAALPLVAATQVQIIIPDNGRDAPQIKSASVQQLSDAQAVSNNTQSAQS
jgi:hypothetical protein